MNKRDSDLQALQKAILMQRLQKRMNAQVATQQAERIAPVDRSAPLPLSSSQQRLWFVDQLDRAAGAAYHMPSALQLDGRLDRDALQAALDRIVARHEVLRTTFVDVDGVATQHIAAADAGFALLERDLRDLRGDEQHAAVASISHDEVSLPFDLAAGPLIRGQLLQLDSDRHLLLITQHHIISDGWSVAVLVREFSALYAAFVQGKDDPLPPLAIQYADYAAWQRQYMDADRRRAHVEFFTSQLAGAPDLLSLPTDRPRPARQSYRGGRATIALPAELSAALRALSQRHGATLFMTLLAGWSLLLSRHSGQRDVVVGTPVANRQRSELESLIGFFVNTLALRVNLDDEPSVAELLQRVKTSTLAAFEHQELPFEHVVDALQPTRSMSHSPLFQVMLSLNNTPGSGRLELPGLVVTPVEQQYDTAQFDLSLALTDDGECIAGDLRYASDLFDAATIERMLGQFERLLGAMVADEALPVDRLPLLDAAERQQMLAGFNDEIREFGGIRLIHQRFEAQARQRPDAVALRCDNDELSYGELNRRANRLAHHLIGLGVRPDDRVALCVERGIDMLVGLLAILKAGAGYVPLDPTYPLDRLAFIVEDSAPVAVLAQHALQDRLPSLAVPLLLLDDVALQSTLADHAEHDPQASLLGLAPRHLAYVIYTSGSTGKPKGVMVTHANVTRLFSATDPWFGFGADDVWTLFHSFAFDFSVWEIWGALAYGGRLVVVPYATSRSPLDFYALLVRERVTVLNQTPSAFRQLIAAQGDDGAAHALRCVVFGGEALDPVALRPWYQREALNGGSRLVNMYGITETTVHVTYRELQPEDCERAGSSPIGRQIPDLQIYILDPHGEPVPFGVAGEMYVGGAGVARGYLNRPELSRERFVADPFSGRDGARLYRTGDLARRLADGSIDYIGRIDFQVKIRGFRIELGEIEAQLAAHAGIRSATVIVREDTPGDKRLVAYYVPADDAANALTAEALRAHLLQALPDYMVPAAYIALPAMPLTGNGKLDRNALPAPDVAAFATHAYVAPTTAIETALCAIWADVLGLERVGVNDNYFDIGGDSIRSIALVAKAKAQGLDLAIVDVFQHPTVAALAREIAGRGEGEDTTAEVVLRDEDRARLPASVEDAYPVTLLQMGMIFHNEYAQGSGLYHDVSSNCVTLPAWQPDTLQAVLDALAAKHPVLRTSFDLRGYGEPLQLVHASASLPMTLFDLSMLDTAEQDRLIGEFIDAERRTRFDLSAAPLLRVFVHRRGPSTIQFTLSFHHAILDGWSLASLQTELFTAYAALVASGERTPQLAPLSLTPKATIEQERRALQSEAHREFWRETLDGHVFSALPPADGDIDDGMTRGRGAQLDAALVAGLQSLAARLGVPLKTVLLAAHMRALSLLSGNADVTTGLVCNVRPEQAQGEQVLGLFLNTLPLRQRLASTSWSELVRQTYQAELSVLQYREYPYFQLHVDNGRRPLFEVIFNFTNFHVYDGLRASQGEQDGRSQSFESTGFALDVNFDFHPERGILLELTPGSLSPAQTERALGGYLAILSAMVAAPDAPHDQAPLLSADECRLLRSFNATHRAHPQALLHELFETRAAMSPDTIALVAGEESLSYAELNRRANRLAHTLHALGVEPDDRIAICLHRGVDMVVGLLGILKAGAAYVPLDPSYPTARLAHMLADSAPAVLLTESALGALLPAGELPRLVIDDADAAATIAAHSDANLPAATLGLDAGHLAYVIYTSGSTGLPKGVAVEHRNVVNLVHGHIHATGLDAGDRVLQFASISFDVAVGEIFPALAVGARLVLRPAQVVAPDAEFLALLDAQQITVCDLPTAFWQQWAQAIAAGSSRRPDSLRRVIVGGDKAEPRHLAAWFGVAANRDVRWINMYGPTEATVSATAIGYDGTDALPGDAVPIGRPLANVQVHILDGFGQPVPVGVCGEIHIGGAGIARGYLDRPQLTAERFIADRFSDVAGARLYRTGDLGRWRNDGSIEFLGRNDHQVKIRGYRIELGEIENRLAACAGVREALVVAADDQHGGKRLVAYVIAADGAEPTAASLRAELATGLADYMLPGAFVMLPAFPLLPNGKVDLQALPAPDGASVVAREYEAPQTGTERAIAGIWQSLLGIGQVGRDDHFFELGGHSLMVVRLIEAMREAGLELDVATVFAVPTLSAMAAAVDAGNGAATAFVAPPNGIVAGTPSIDPSMLPLVEFSQSEIDAIVASVPGGVGNIQDIYPLGPAQEGILFHHMLQPGRDAYLLRTSLAFDGRERLDAFVAALQAIIDRHDILRSTIRWDGLSRPVQVVLREAQLPVRELQLPDDVGTDAEQHFLALTDPAVSSLGLQDAPLLVACIGRNPASGEWLLALLHHHIVCDHVTVEIMMTELQALLHDDADCLPAPLPYRNFIAQTLAAGSADHEGYFRRVLGDVAEPTAPFGVLDVQGDGGRVEEFHLPLADALSAGIRDAARRLGVTPAVLFHVAAARVIAACAGRDDVVFGTVTSGRLQGSDGAGQVLGMFINTLPLRLRLAGQGVADAVRDTHASLGELLRHEQASLSVAQRCSAVAPSMPLFTTLLNYRHSHHASADDAKAWAGIRVLSDDERTNYPITICIDDFGQGFGISMQCVAGIGAGRVAECIATAMHELVDALADDPQRAVMALQVLPASERQRVLVEFNATDVPYTLDTLLHADVERQAARDPDAVALQFGAEQVTYGELNRRANRLAHALIERGVGPDQRVAICVERSIEMVVGLLAILKAGGAYVPLDPAYPADRLSYMLADSDPALVLVHAATRELMQRLGASRVLDLDGDQSLWQGLPAGNPCVAGLTPQHLAYIIYTSGSTGQPKGAMNEHRAVVNRLLWMQDAYGLGADDRVLQKTPFSFDVSVWEFFWPLRCGAQLVIAKPDGHRDPVYLAELIREARITTLHFVPSMLQVFLEHGDVAGCSSLARVICSGEALPASLAARCHALLPDTELHNLYGPTEAAIDVTAWHCRPGDPRGVPIGRPIANTRVYILDECLQPLPQGVAGELYLAGVQVGRGYFNRPELTAERFVRDPFAGDPGARMYRTGDLGRHRDDGAIEYLGRNDFQVKIRGFRIELGEIEARLASVDGVREAVVIAREDVPGDRRLVAYLTLHDEAVAPATDELRAHLLAQLPDYMVPAAFVVLPELPLSGNGKLERRLLPAPDGEAFASQPYQAPAGEMETALAAIWSEVLGIERVGANDNFFELGGDSIRSIAVVGKARARGLELAIVDIFKSPTVATLASMLAQRSATPQALAPVELLTAEDRAKLPADVVDAYPLLLLQMGMIFHNELAEGSGVYHDVFSTGIVLPDWRPDLLRAALDAMSRRHPVLRTSFDLRTYSEPMQCVHASALIPLELIDIAGLVDAEQEQLIAEFVDDERRTRFELDRAPLLRVFVHDRGAGSIQFTLSFHHAILDGWSIASLQTELFNAYADLLAGVDASLERAPLAVTPRAAVSSERHALQSGAHREFWQQHLAEHQFSALPPADADATAGSARSVPVAIAPQITERLQALAASLGVPMRSVLLAAHLRAIAVVAGKHDVTTGLVCNVRPEDTDGDKVLGLFLNTLPFRRRLASGSWADLVRDTHADELELLRHRHYPYFQLHVDNGRNPYYEIVFNYTNFHVYDGLSAASGEAGFRQAFESTGYALGVNFSFDPAAGISLELNAEQLSPAQAERIGGYYATILQAMAFDPQGQHDAGCLLSRDEIALLATFNASAAEQPQPQLIHRLFEAQADAHPQAAAVTFEGNTLGYAELNRQANRLAHYLRGLGVKPDDRVAICVDRGIDMIVCMLGILKAGAAYLPLDPAYPAERIAYMLADAAPVALLTQAAVVDSLPATQLTPIVVDDDLHRTLIAAQQDGNPDADAIGLQPGHLAYVIYTSGSTGQPKGVMNHHAGLCNLARAQIAEFDVRGDSRVLQFVSFSFDVCISEVTMALCSGACLALAPPAELLPGEPLLATLQAQRITHVSLPMAVLATLPPDAELPDLRTLIVGGDVLPPALANHWSNRCALFNSYGPTESTVCATNHRCSGDEQGSVPIGRPLANTRIHVLDARMQPVPVGTTGELYIGGAGVARGYLDREALTAERFVVDPFAEIPDARLYRTGDLGRWRSDGNLEFLGRNDFQVKIRGFRIELGEIESRLAACDGVREAVVIAREDVPGDKRLVAYLVANPAAVPAVADLRTQLSAGLADYMIPSAFVVLDALPLTPNGKLDRAALPVPDRIRNDAEYVAPRNPVEETLCRVWADVLRLDRVGIHDHFFELGGNSLLLVKLHSQLAVEFPERLTIADYFKHTTVARLAVHIENGVDAGARLPDSVSRAETRRNRMARRQNSRAERVN